MQREIKIEYVPNQKQAQFHSSGEDDVLYGGAKGGGKSCALVEEAHAWGYEHPGANMYIFRETYDALDSNIIREWKAKIPPELYRYNEGKHCAKLLNGTVINFRYCADEADAEKYQGVSMDWLRHRRVNEAHQERGTDIKVMFKVNEVQAKI